MRPLAVVLGLLLAFSAQSGSLEDITLVGLTKSGTTVELKYSSELAYQKNLGDFFIGPAAYGYCRPEGSTVQDEYFLYCSKTIGGEPTLVYRSPAYTDPKTKLTSSYKKAKQLCTQLKIQDCDPRSHYVCERGCTSEIVDVFLNLTEGPS